MRAFLHLSVLLTLLGIILADISVGNYSDPSHPGKCLLYRHLVLSPGKHPNPYSCGEINCSGNGLTSIHTCGSITTDIAGCTMGEYSKELNYPQCCKRKLICPKKPELNGKFAPL